MVADCSAWTDTMSLPALTKSAAPHISQLQDTEMDFFVEDTEVDFI